MNEIIFLVEEAPEGGYTARARAGDRRLRLPRDVSGADLARRLSHMGYRITRQTVTRFTLRA